MKVCSLVTIRLQKLNQKCLMIVRIIIVVPFDRIAVIWYRIIIFSTSYDNVHKSNSNKLHFYHNSNVKHGRAINMRNHHQCEIGSVVTDGWSGPEEEGNTSPFYMRDSPYIGTGIFTITSINAGRVKNWSEFQSALITDFFDVIYKTLQYGEDVQLNS